MWNTHTLSLTFSPTLSRSVSLLLWLSLLLSLSLSPSFCISLSLCLSRSLVFSLSLSLYTYTYVNIYRLKYIYKCICTYVNVYIHMSARPHESCKICPPALMSKICNGQPRRIYICPPAPMNYTYVRPPLWVKYLRASPAEMPFQNWYTANTNHFRLTHSVRWKSKT